MIVADMLQQLQIAACLAACPREYPRRITQLQDRVGTKNAMLHINTIVTHHCHIGDTINVNSQSL